ncbi:MAG: PQQ-dependent sugar dehydrogenase [Acidobacteriota bacterium]
MGSSPVRFLLTLALCAALGGCYAMRPSQGGGETQFSPPRAVNPADIALPEGYRIEAVATGLTFPTGVAFDEAGTPYVVEAGYSYGEVWTVPRLLRVEGGQTKVMVEGGKNGPWTGVTYHKGAFYVAEGGTLEGGRILRITPDGAVTRIIEGLPSKGDHHTNGPVIGPDGWIYFSIGTFTNSGVVGEDNAKFGWLTRSPDQHDIPCQDITLAGENFTTPNVLKPETGENVTTGAFVSFGKSTRPGEIIRGQVPCNGSVLRIRPEGGQPELVAWGFRNPFGLAFDPDGNLFITENQYDERGSRPVFGAGDLLWRVKSGTWYGWPDFHGAYRLDMSDRYQSPGKDKPKLLLAKHPNDPQVPAAILGDHASADGFDFSRGTKFGHVGEAFIAEFGDEAPTTGKVLGPVGFKVVRVDTKTGVINDFAANRGNTNGPASKLGKGGLERPLAARFTPDGSALYVVDFGVMMQSKQGAIPQKGTGVLWRIVPTAK